MSSTDDKFLQCAASAPAFAPSEEGWAARRILLCPTPSLEIATYQPRRMDAVHRETSATRHTGCRNITEGRVGSSRAGPGRAPRPARSCPASFRSVRAPQPSPGPATAPRPHGHLGGALVHLSPHPPDLIASPSQVACSLGSDTWPSGAPPSPWCGTVIAAAAGGGGGGGRVVAAAAAAVAVV